VHRDSVRQPRPASSTRNRDVTRDVIVFERDGRTCVLSGEVLRRETLVKLAA
jgi:hypothetical protein